MNYGVAVGITGTEVRRWSVFRQSHASTFCWEFVPRPRKCQGQERWQRPLKDVALQPVRRLTFHPHMHVLTYSNKHFTLEASRSFSNSVFGGENAFSI